MSVRKPRYIGFSPLVEPSGLVIGAEKIANMQPELAALHREHYAETETLYRAQYPCNPDYQRWMALEEMGQFVVFTARFPGEMVGYLQYYVFRDMHSKEVYIAKEDAFFVTKDFRGKGVAPKLLAFAEDSLRKLGCKSIGMSNKAPVGGPDIGGFLERRGYRPVATFYVKHIEE